LKIPQRDAAADDLMATLAFEVFTRWPGFEGELVPTLNRHRHMELLLSHADSPAIRVRPAPDQSGWLSMLYVQGGKVEIHLQQQLHDVLNRIKALVTLAEYSAVCGSSHVVSVGPHRASEQSS
jgi:hypothetical protein